MNATIEELDRIIARLDVLAKELGSVHGGFLGDAGSLIAHVADVLERAELEHREWQSSQS